MAVLFKVYLLLLGRVVAPFTSELELRAGREGAEKKTDGELKRVFVSRHVTIRLVSSGGASSKADQDVACSIPTKTSTLTTLLSTLSNMKPGLWRPIVVLICFEQSSAFIPPLSQSSDKLPLLKEPTLWSPSPSENDLPRHFRTCRQWREILKL
jgi:hypothetical protein